MLVIVMRSACMFVLLCVACSSFEAAERPDAAAASDAPVTGCAHDFCATFDEEPFDAPWTGIGGGAAEIVLAPVTEPGASRFLRATVPANERFYQRRYLRRLVTPAPKTKATYAFRARLKQKNTRDGHVGIASISWGPEDDATETLVRLTDEHVEGRLQFPDGAGGRIHRSTDIKTLGVGAWRVITVSLSLFSPDNVVLELGMDGANFATRVFEPKSLPVDGVTLGLGILDLGSPDGSADYTETIVDFDDVTYDGD